MCLMCFLWLGFAVAFLALFLGWFCFAWACCRWRSGFNLGRRDFRFWLCLRRILVGLRRWRHCHLFQLGFSGAGRQGILVCIFLCVCGEFRTFSSQFSLTLPEKFAHVFRHLRSFRKLFLGLVFEKCLHEIDKHRQR